MANTLKNQKVQTVVVVTAVLIYGGWYLWNCLGPKERGNERLESITNSRGDVVHIHRSYYGSAWGWEAHIQKNGEQLEVKFLSASMDPFEHDIDAGYQVQAIHAKWVSDTELEVSVPRWLRAGRAFKKHQDITITYIPEGPPEPKK